MCSYGPSVATHCHAPLATSAVSAAAAAAAKPGFTPLIAICFYAMCDRRGAARFGRLTKVVEAAALWGGGDAGTPDTGRGGQPPGIFLRASRTWFQMADQHPWRLGIGAGPHGTAAPRPFFVRGVLPGVFRFLLRRSTSGWTLLSTPQVSLPLQMLLAMPAAAAAAAAAADDNELLANPVGLRRPKGFHNAEAAEAACKQKWQKQHDC